MWCVVVAAGSGRRFGGPKQLSDLRGATVMERSVATAAAACDGVVLVVAPDDLASDGAASRASSEVPDGVDRVVAGGATRSASVSRGLAAVPADAAVVLVHDAARPLASAELFRRVADAVRGGADAAVPVVAVVDTIRDVRGGTVDRDVLRAVQTPQGFRAAALRDVHSTPADATDDASLVEAAGGSVVLVEGERTNLKITEAVDLDLAAALVDRSGRDGGDSTP